VSASVRSVSLLTGLLYRHALSKSLGLARSEKSFAKELWAAAGDAAAVILAGLGLLWVAVECAWNELLEMIRYERELRRRRKGSDQQVEPFPRLAVHESWG
jgi:hypothetical protein